MSALVSAELLRLRTVHSPLLIAVGALALMLAMTAAPILGDAAGSAQDVRDALRGIPIVAVLLAATFAAARVGGDFKQGASTLSYLAEPRRDRVGLARVAVYGGVGAVFGGLAAALVCAAGLAAADAQGIDPGFAAADVAGLVAGSAVAAGLLSGAGVLLGLLTRNATVASTAVVLWNAMENLLALLGIGDVLPFRLVGSLLGTASDVPAPAAAGLLLAYLLAGGAAVVRWALPRDLT